MQTPKTSPNLPLGTVGFWAGGIFWLMFGEALEIIHRRLFGSDVTSSSAPLMSDPSGSWWNATVAVPLWVVLAAFLTGLLFAYWGVVYWSIRWWIPHKLEGMLAPSTFREELLGLARVTLTFANSRGRNPSSEESLAAALSYLAIYQDHVLCARAKLRKLPSVGQDHPLMNRWANMGVLMTTDDVRTTGEFLEQLAWLVPSDVLPLTRPAIGEKWTYDP
jgi:hypothetical protein